MDRFFDEKNIARYRQLRDAGMDKTQRAMILKQLAEEAGMIGADARPNWGERCAPGTER
jgi:hypothetical protein